VLRTNFFGRSHTGIGLADWLLRELGASRPVVGFQDVVFSALDVATLAALILELASTDIRGTLHLGASDAVSKFTFAQFVAKAYDFDPELVRPGLLADAGLSAPRPLDTSLDSGNAAKALGSALPTVATGVSRMCSGASSEAESRS
jgi:dTDP-4-dehydrorhamnose reductase